MRMPSHTPIAAVAASAPGGSALKSFFEALGPEPDAAFVLFGSPEAALHSAMPVVPLEHTTQLEVNHIYSCGAHEFGEWLADSPNSDLTYAIILTDDGAVAAETLALETFKSTGGIVLVQEPAAAGQGPVPGIPIEVADCMLPARALATRLLELLRLGPQRARGKNEHELLSRIIAHLQVMTGHDFSSYDRTMLVRQIARRARITRNESLDAYDILLRGNGEEAQLLCRDLLSPVTAFFRDPDAFNVLTRDVMPQLFAGKQAGDHIRVWVPGCATGEEAYTLGILLLEEAARRGCRPDIQIFASDLDAGALAAGREGRYPASIEARVSQQRLHRFFHRDDDHYRVGRELRNIVLFATHNILRDPPFAHLDLISCRNLLVQLDPQRQPQVCCTYHYALNPGGFLFLGAAEPLEHPLDLFTAVNRDARLYRPTAGAKKRKPSLAPASGSRPLSARPAMARAFAMKATRTHAALHLHMLERTPPASILVEESFRALHLSRNAGRFLHLPEGPLATDVTEMVREELRMELRAALRRAFERNETLLSKPLTVKFDDSTHQVCFQVRPVSYGADATRYALVIFIEGETLGQDPVAANLTHDNSGQTVRLLRQELRLTQDRLRASLAESAATTAELRAANEEFQSISEEYRSTSEELETSQEELQSINEELQTLNSELKAKLETVSRAHSDLQNLMAATDFGTLFLDAALRIKRYTPRVMELFNIRPSDEGRPITDFTHQLDYDSLPDHLREVLAHLTQIEREVPSRDGGRYLVRIRPYRTIDHKIDGVVATFLDMTQLRETELRLETLVGGIPQLVWRAGHGGLWSWASPQWTRFTGQSEPDSRGWGWLEPLHPNDRQVAREAWSHAVERGGFEVEYRIHGQLESGYRWFQTRATPVRDEAGTIVEWLGTSTDIHQLRELQDRQKVLVAELQHRTRNLVSVVQAMSDRTIESSADLADFRTQFDDRLQALMRVQGLLSRLNDGDRVAFDELIHSELTALKGSLDRIELEGPAGIRLRSSTMQTLAMALHELATNSVKYGALGQPQAHLAIRWRMEPPDERGGPRLHIDWRESGVVMPAATLHPRGTGHGRELIEQALPYQLDAETSFELGAEGLHCTILLPVSASNLDSAAAD